MKPDEFQKIEQSAQTLIAHFPMMWWGMFRNLQEQGFTEEQAMDLLKTYILATCGRAK